MYSVDQLDEVIELQDVPQSDVGAPAPVLLAQEGRVLLAYLIQLREHDAWAEMQRRLRL